MDKTKYLIVGGGVTGLAFANFIKSDDYMIIEKENRVGGYCKTNYCGEYIWDYAGHFFHFKTKFMKDYFKKLIDDKEIIYSVKNTKILYKSNLVDFPFQKNIHQLPKEEFIDCIYDLFNRESNESDSFKEMIYEKFGKSIAEKFLIPYNEKLYACDLNHLDKSAMGRFFPYATEKEIIDNFKISDNDSYNNEFLYPRKGAQYFVDLLQSKCKKDNIFLNEYIISIDSKNKIAKTNKRKIQYEYLISSISFDSLLDSLNYEYSSDVLSGNKVLVFNIGFDKKGMQGIHWMYIPDKKYNFYRIGFYDNILRTDKMSLYVEIGLDSNEKFDVDKEYIKVLKGLKECGIIEDHKVIAYESIIMKPAYAHISKKGEEFVAETRLALETKNIYSLGRYGQWKYCSIEDSMIDAYELASIMNKFE